MVRFLDGPAAGVALALSRAPIYLRVVQDETTGRFDALDRLDDTPGPSERVHVYHREDYGGVVFACTRPASGSSQLVVATYRHVEMDGEAFRGTEAWRQWCHGREEARPKAEAIS